MVMCSAAPLPVHQNAAWRPHMQVLSPLSAALGCPLKAHTHEAVLESMLLRAHSPVVWQASSRQGVGSVS
eukprot:1066017-Pelagomonas_calceolata.AAC.4